MNSQLTRVSAQCPRERFYSDGDPIETFPYADADGGIKYELYYPPVPRALDSRARIHYMWNVDKDPDEFFNDSSRKIVADDDFVVLVRHISIF